MTKHQHPAYCLRPFVWQSGNQAHMSLLLATQNRHEESTGNVHIWMWSHDWGTWVSQYLSEYRHRDGPNYLVFLDRLTAQSEMSTGSAEVSTRHFPCSCINCLPAVSIPHLALHILETWSGEVNQTAVAVLSRWNSLRNKSRFLCVIFCMGEGAEGTDATTHTCSSIAPGYLVVST